MWGSRMGSLSPALPPMGLRRVLGWMGISLQTNTNTEPCPQGSVWGSNISAGLPPWLSFFLLL